MTFISNLWFLLLCGWNVRMVKSLAITTEKDERESRLTEIRPMRRSKNLLPSRSQRISSLSSLSSLSSDLKMGNVDASPFMVLDQFEEQFCEEEAYQTHKTTATTELNNKQTLRFSSFEKHLYCTKQSTVTASNAAFATTIFSSPNPSWKSVLTYVGIFTLGGVLTAAALIAIAPVPSDPSLTRFAPGLALQSNGVIRTVLRRTTNQLRGVSFSRPKPSSYSHRSALHLGIDRFRTYLRTKILPGAIPMLKAMVVMELWRQIWSRTFRFLRRIYYRVFRHRYDQSLWKKYVPAVFRVGLKSMGVRAVQKRVSGLVAGWLGGWELIGEWVGEGAGEDTVFEGEVDDLVVGEGSLFEGEMDDLVGDVGVEAS